MHGPLQLVAAYPKIRLQSSVGNVGVPTRGAPPSAAIRSVLATTCDLSCCPSHVDSIWVSAECAVKVPQSNDVPDNTREAR